jgi:magnesium chelatase accessory protein
MTTLRSGARVAQGLTDGDATPRQSRRLRFETDSRGWPNRDASRFVTVAGIDWHVQVVGTGPVLLMVHGTGASTHSFAGLVDVLSDRFTLLSFDLPGHAFTSPPPGGRITLPRMAEVVSQLVAVIGLSPSMAIGHSAGAAILLRMMLDGRLGPIPVISLNGALSGFRGMIGRTFSPLAKLLAINPLVPQLVAWRASDPSVLARLLGQTGSDVPSSGAATYARLARDPDHVAAALAMMAGWNLDPLWRDLIRIPAPVVLVAGGRDGMVPPDQVFEAAERIPHSQVVLLRRLGHLAHEEDPAAVAKVVLDTARRHGVIGEERS